MESRRKRSSSQSLKWVCYTFCWCCVRFCRPCRAVPVGAAKPLWLLPLCLAVSAAEGEFAGAIFRRGVRPDVGLYRGRTVGMLALELMILCFGVSRGRAALSQGHPSNFVLLARGLRPAGAVGGLAVFLLYAGLCGRSGAFSLGRAPARPDDGPGQLLLHRAVRGRSAWNSRSTTAWCDATHPAAEENG